MCDAVVFVWGHKPPSYSEMKHVFEKLLTEWFSAFKNLEDQHGIMGSNPYNSENVLFGVENFRFCDGFK